MHAMNSKTELTNSSVLSDTIVGSYNVWRWGVPLFAGLALAILLALDSNVQLFYWMNRLMSYAPDGLWTHFSLLGEGHLVILLVLLFLGRSPDIVWQYVLATLLTGLFVFGMKELFSALRPPASLLEGSFHLIGPALQNNSFPSGHTTAAFALAGLACLQRTHNGIKFVALLLAIFVGFSRIANGVHWPVDVLAGAIAGWLLAIAAGWLSQYWRVGLNIWVQRVFAAIFTPISVWATWSLWQQYHDVYLGTGLMIILLFFIGLGLSVPGQLRLFNLRK